MRNVGEGRNRALSKPQFLRRRQKDKISGLAGFRIAAKSSATLVQEKKIYLQGVIHTHTHVDSQTF